jgi:hypothetical protein
MDKNLRYQINTTRLFFLNIKTLLKPQTKARELPRAAENRKNKRYSRSKENKNTRAARTTTKATHKAKTQEAPIH